MAPVAEVAISGGRLGRPWINREPSARVCERGHAYTKPRQPEGPVETLAALTLNCLPGMGDTGFRVAVDRFGSASAALARPAELQALWPRLKMNRVVVKRASHTAREVLARSSDLGCSVWSYGGVGYPVRLGALHDPPALLWGHGNPRWVDPPAACAIVGSRKASPYGVRTAQTLAHHLAGSGFVVVSGMALGVDGAAHRGALDAGGVTVAVLGSGVDTPTPRSQRGLYEDIVRTGLVLSEFAPGTQAAAHHFPKRNRIIAALTPAVVVVEAAARSGALITVDHALDLGGSVFAVPGPIDTTRSRGTNALLADGASVVVSAQGLVEALGGAARMHAAGAGTELPEGDGVAAIWAELEDGPSDIDALVQKLGLDVQVVVAALGALELEGRVAIEPGARYVRTGGGPA